MGKQVEALKHHANFGAYMVDVLEIFIQHYTVYNDGALLMFFKAIDAANQSRFP
jgi:hypothetical protein